MWAVLVLLALRAFGRPVSQSVDVWREGDLRWVLVSSTFRLLTGVSSSEVMSSSVIVFFWRLAMMALSSAFLISSSS